MWDFFQSQHPLNLINPLNLVGSLAQLDRASDFGSEGWGFESLRARSVQFAFLLTLLSGCARVPSLIPQPAPQAESCRARPLGNQSAQIHWFGPDRPDDYRELWWRCIGVGPAVISKVETLAEPVDSLMIISWNVHVGGAHLAELLDDLRTGRLTEGVPVRHFVLLLQEAYRSGLDSPPPGFIGSRSLVEQPAHGPRVDITESARAFDLNLYYLPSTRNGNRAADREDRGNAILSTLPLEDFGAYELPFEIHRRVAQSAAVSGRTAAGKPWRLMLGNAHLEATLVRPAMWRDLGYGRKRQARALVELWAHYSAIVIGGDFNTLFKGEWALGLFERRIGRIERSDGRATRPPLQPDHLFARLPRPWRIDPYRRLDSTYHSDHYPLITRVIFLGN